MSQKLSLKFCPTCAEKNINSRLHLFQINFESAVLLCSNDQCVIDGGSVTFVDRKFEELRSRTQAKKKSTSSRNSTSTGPKLSKPEVLEKIPDIPQPLRLNNSEWDSADNLSDLLPQTIDSFTSAISPSISYETDMTSTEMENSFAKVHDSPDIASKIDDDFWKDLTLNADIYACDTGAIDLLSENPILAQCTSTVSNDGLLDIPDFGSELISTQSNDLNAESWWPFDDFFGSGDNSTKSVESGDRSSLSDVFNSLALLDNSGNVFGNNCFQDASTEIANNINNHLLNTCDSNVSCAADQCTETSDTPKLSSDNFTSSLAFPHWIKNAYSSWLDALLSLVVHNRFVRETVHNDASENTIKKLVEIYCAVVMDLNSNDVDSVWNKVSSTLEIIQEDVLKFLKTTLGLNTHGNAEECLVKALTLLFSDSEAVKSLFEFSSFWQRECDDCGVHCENIQQTLLASFSECAAVRNFPVCYIEEPCITCSRKKQIRHFKFDRIPNTFALHFAKGLSHARLTEYDFEYSGSGYRVSAVVQKESESNHFVTWVRHNTDEKWMCCSNTLSSYSKFSYVPPSLVSKHIRIVVWEKIWNAALAIQPSSQLIETAEVIHNVDMTECSEVVISCEPKPLTVNIEKLVKNSSSSSCSAGSRNSVFANHSKHSYTEGLKNIPPLAPVCKRNNSAQKSYSKVVNAGVSIPSATKRTATLDTDETIYNDLSECNTSFAMQRFLQQNRRSANSFVNVWNVDNQFFPTSHDQNDNISIKFDIVEQENPGSFSLTSSEQHQNKNVEMKSKRKVTGHHLKRKSQPSVDDAPFNLALKIPTINLSEIDNVIQKHMKKQPQRRSYAKKQDKACLQPKSRTYISPPNSDRSNASDGDISIVSGIKTTTNYVKGNNRLKAKVSSPKTVPQPIKPILKRAENRLAKDAVQRLLLGSDIFSSTAS